MKYFRFSCESKYRDYGYLSTMYEYYFRSMKTDGISSLRVRLCEKVPQDITTTTTDLDVYITIDWREMQKLSKGEMANYSMDLIHNAIIQEVIKRKRDRQPFDDAYQHIKATQCLFRLHWGRKVSSPDKQLKAQVYFEYDYEKQGTFIDFTHNNTLIKRVKFIPRGYPVLYQMVGPIKWINNTKIQVFYIQTPRAGTDWESNKKNYWTVDIDGTTEFHNIKASEHDPQGLFQLGTDYVQGTITIKNEEKGINLIKESASLQYKHAQNRLRNNITTN